VQISIPSACVKTAPTHAHVRTRIVHIHTRARPCIKNNTAIDTNNYISQYACKFYASDVICDTLK